MLYIHSRVPVERQVVAVQTSTSTGSIERLSIPSSLAFLAPAALGDLIRVGRTNDGGYVIPQSSVEMADFLISFGVSDDWSFEEHFKKINPQIRIHAYDHTISRTVFGLSLLRGILKLPLGKTSLENLSHRWELFASYNRFFLGKARHFPERISNRTDRGKAVTTAIAFQRNSSNRIFLKVDIEGDEYQIIKDLTLLADRVVGMVVEFHQTTRHRALFVESIRSLQTVYDIAHFHANNFAPVASDGLPEALELTFVRKSDFDCSKKRLQLPLPQLDSPNSPCKPDYQITFLS
jgi:hypothetical protein